MIWQGLVVNLFLYFYVAEGAVIQYSVGLTDDVLRSYFERKCFKNADYAAFATLEESVKGILVCVSNRYHASSAEEQFNSLCSEEGRHKNYGCLKDLVEKVDPCLEPEEKYLPGYILSSYNRSLELRCPASLDQYKDILEDLRTGISKCSNIQTLMSLSNNQCLVEINSQLSSQQDLTLTKAHLCNALEEVGKCVLDGIKNSCSDDVFPNFVSESWRPHLEICNEND